MKTSECCTTPSAIPAASPVERIWVDFGKGLAATICKKTGHLDHCHDILHDVYLKLYDNIDKVTVAGNIGGYLNRMAHNTVVDYYRQQNTPFAIEEELIMEEHTETSTQLADCCLRPMIESLPEKYRDALIKVEIEGMPQKVLADSLGLSLSAAKSRVQRAREKLKEVVMNCCRYEFDRYGNILDCKKESCS